jgi:histidinol phosphatase-like PHP family hydrolase
MHTQWSDGHPLPQWAVDWYKSHGYHFICPSDHNIFQSNDLRFDGFGFRTHRPILPRSKVRRRFGRWFPRLPGGRN